MSNYNEMYIMLFNKITDIIEELQQIQCQTEELFIRDGDPKLMLLKSCKDEQPKRIGTM